MEGAVDLVLDEVVGAGRLRLALGTTRGAQSTQPTEDVRLTRLPVVRRVLPQERRRRRHRLGREEEEEGVTVVVAVVFIDVVVGVLVIVYGLLRTCHPPLRHRCCCRHGCGGFPDGIR